MSMGMQWGTCYSESRYNGKRTDTENVYFIPFPKPEDLLINAENVLGLVIDHTNKLTWRP